MYRLITLDKNHTANGSIREVKDSTYNKVVEMLNNNKIQKIRLKSILEFYNNDIKVNIKYFIDITAISKEVVINYYVAPLKEQDDIFEEEDYNYIYYYLMEELQLTHKREQELVRRSIINFLGSSISTYTSGTKFYLNHYLQDIETRSQQISFKYKGIKFNWYCGTYDIIKMEEITEEEEISNFCIRITYEKILEEMINQKIC